MHIVKTLIVCLNICVCLYLSNKYTHIDNTFLGVYRLKMPYNDIHDAL